MSHSSATKVEALLDDVQQDPTFEASDEVDQRIVYSDVRQVAIDLLQRQFIDAGVTARIEAFCEKQDTKMGRSLSFGELYEAVESNQNWLIPDAIKLDVMQVAVDFVDRFFPPRNGQTTALNASSSSSDSLSTST